MRAAIGKRFKFEAAHFLTGVPKEHKCARTHGHSYTVELQAYGPVDPATGMVVDYAELTYAMAPLLRRLDHSTLNETAGLGNPTAENIARWILERLNKPFRLAPMLEVTEVTVWEGDDNWATVARDCED